MTKMNKTLLTLGLAAALLPKAAFAINIVPSDSRPKDAFGLDEACAIVDARFIRQPTVRGAVDMLGPCMKALSVRYGVTITAGPAGPGPDGKEAGLHILIGGHLPVGNPALYNLNYALNLRGNRIVCRPVRVVSLHPLLKGGETTMRVQKKLKRLPKVFALQVEMTDAPSIGISGPLN